MFRPHSFIFSFETLAFRGDGKRSALTAALIAIGLFAMAEVVSRAALEPIGRYWEYPRSELAVTYEWFRSESEGSRGFDVVIAGDSTAARNIDPRLLASELGDELRACNLGWPANFPLAFKSLTLPILQSTTAPPARLILSFSPGGFVDSPIARQFEGGLLSSPICRREDQG